MKTKTELKKEYKETPRPMGVFMIRNTLTNEYVMGMSRNLDGELNKYRFMLKMGGASDNLLDNPKLQEDYRRQGTETFEFKVLDTIKPKDEPGWDPTKDLDALEKMWGEELKGRGWTAY